MHQPNQGPFRGLECKSQVPAMVSKRAWSNVPNGGLSTVQEHVSAEAQSDGGLSDTTLSQEDDLERVLALLA